MNIPNFLNARFVDEKGFLTEQWQQILMQLFSELQNNCSNEGLKVPMQSNAEPEKIIDKLNNEKSKSALLYDSDTNKLLISLNGTFKEIQTN